MSETELFDAYRNLYGYGTACVCGLWIQASCEAEVPESVALHNASAEHLTWRSEQDAVDALRRQPVRVCTCHGHDA